MEEHRPDTGDRQDGGQAAGQPRGDIGETDYVRHRPRRPRSEVRHRLAQTQARTGLAAQPAVRGRNRKTVRWYLQNQKWMDDITSGEYQQYYQSMYKDR